MTVAELIAELQKLPPEHVVVLQEDPEGNGYRRARGAEEGMYTQERYEGTFVSREHWEEDKEWYDEDAVFVENAVVIWP